MIVNPHSKLWTYPGGAESEMLYFGRFEVLLRDLEEHLIDEYIETSLEINRCEPEDCQFPDAKLHWWVGRQEMIEDMAHYMNEAYEVKLDKLLPMFFCIPRYKDMSVKSQENYRRIVGEVPD